MHIKLEKISQKTPRENRSDFHSYKFFSHFALDGLIMPVTNRDRISDNLSFHYASVRFVPISRCFHG